MKTKILPMLIIAFCLAIKSNAQMTYNQGDISASSFFNASHDSIYCQTTGNEMYMITINNSFIGDSVVMKDQFSGFVFAFAVNTTGQNPWTTTLMPNNIIPVIPDHAITSGIANFIGNPMKIISGIDTINFVYGVYSYPVPNPCLYGTFSGKIYHDNNSDCVFNTGDEPLQQIPVLGLATLTSPQVSFYQNGYSGTNGNYSAIMQQSWMTSFNVSIPNPNFQFIFPLSSCNPASYTYTSLSQSNVDFALQCSSQIDVQAYGASPSSARPAIPFVIHPIVNNTGCDSASGVLTLIKDPNTIYNASLSSNPATTVNGDTLTWNYANLTNISNGAYWNSFTAGVHLTPNLSVNIGDTLCFTVKSTIASNDINATNNIHTFCIPVVNSYDPNAKEVMPKGTGTNGGIPIGSTDLKYTIHFQNTGNAPAFNVSIIDTLDSDILPTSLKIIGASHVMSPEWLAPNIVKFNFYNINLPDSISNEPMSHGSVTFNVKLKTGLAINTQIKNTGHIYFDTNPAIVTNTVLNTIVNPQAIQSFDAEHVFSIYPNPVQNELHIDLKQITFDDALQISIQSINGQLIKTERLSKSKTTIDVSNLNAGIYFIILKSNSKSYQYKFVKE